MSDIAIKVENVSKKYELGVIGSGTLYHTLWHYLDKLTGRNKKMLPGEAGEFWALKDINFEVRKGEVIGIIGRNGAGKSTLLKVLSRITEPTTGRITVDGRIASLLEVGTGFHPELTGRENIFLNGSILGMKRAEIKRKFDEIVDFSGVEKFLDTPVKRYSSGMYVRLAFSVAAHLEPEILVIDEVLSVGDAEFQKKSLSKMNEVSQSGRTVLFVSHNMGAVERLCNTGLLLENGRIKAQGDVLTVTSNYLSVNDESERNVISFESQKDGIFIKEFAADEKSLSAGFNEPINFNIHYLINAMAKNIYIMIVISDMNGCRIATGKCFLNQLEEGESRFSLSINGHHLIPNKYLVSFYMSVDKTLLFSEKHCLVIELLESNISEPLLIPHLGARKWESGAFYKMDVERMG